MTIEVPNDALHVAAGDLDGDGDMDAVVVSHAWDFVEPITVLLNEGGGLLRPAGQYEVGASSHSVSISDLDQDGDLDLVVPNTWDGTVGVLMNNGDGTFVPPVLYDVDSGPWYAALGDVDGDGDVDMAIAEPGVQAVELLLNDGSGVFSSAPSVQVPEGASWVALGDLDGDGDLDLVSTDEVTFNEVVHISLNDGAGSFAHEGTYDAGWSPRMIELVDIDGDGDLDIAGACGKTFTEGVTILRNHGDAIFATPDLYLPDLNIRCITPVDIDNDGDQDLFAASEALTSALLMLNDGSGFFSVAQTLDTGPSAAQAVACADLNGDAAADVIVVSEGGQPSYASVFLNAGDGSILTQLSHDMAEKVEELALGDPDGDGDQDLLAWVGPSVYLLANPGDGRLDDPIAMTFDNERDGPHLVDTDLDGDDDAITVDGDGDVLFYESLGGLVFADAVAIPSVWNVDHLTFSDLDGDGDPDLIAQWDGWSYFEVDENLGDGTFVEHAIIYVGIRANHLAVGDLDGDGDGDIVFTKTHSDGALRVFINTGDLQFDEAVVYAAADTPVDVQLGDIDGDGDLDALAKQGTTNLLVQLLNVGDGTFEPYSTFYPHTHFETLLLADLNHDGAADLVLPHLEDRYLDGYSIPILFATGEGLFAEPTRYHTGRGSGAAIAGDVDGDHRADLIVCNLVNPDDDRDLSVLLNLCADGCLGDADGNGVVDQSDLGILLATYELQPDDPLYDPRADFNNDGEVGQPDLGILLAKYHQPCH